MEFVPSQRPSSRPSTLLEIEAQQQKLRSNMRSLLQQESHRQSNSYHKFLKEQRVTEPFITQEAYVPPWRRTMSDIYGEEIAKRMKAPVESYAARANRLAAEEAAIRNKVGGWSRGLHNRDNKAKDL